MKTAANKKISISNLLLVFALASLPLILSACGGTTVQRQNQGGGQGPSPTPTPTQTPTCEQLGTCPHQDPPLSFDFELTGNTGSNPTYITPAGAVDTDSILNVRVTIGSAGSLSAPGWESFNMLYGCGTFRVTVNGLSKTTKTLKVPGATVSQCPDNAESSEVLPFSSRLSPGIEPRIQVDYATNDFYCNLYWQYLREGRMLGGGYSFNCGGNGLKNLYWSHTMRGQLSVQVNGTSAP